MQVEGIPEGWDLDGIRQAEPSEPILDDGGNVAFFGGKTKSRRVFPILKKIEKPKRFRPFANAAEFEPHRDKWIKRGSKHDTEATRPEGCFRVAAYNDHHYWTAEGSCTPYSQAFDDGKCFEDGTPFGVEVIE